jgi:two-component system response regulator GlrR
MTEKAKALENARLLIVDDDEDMLALLARWFEPEGVVPVTAHSGREALERLDIERPDAVITDLVMDGMDGLKLLAEIHRRDPVMPVVMVSGHAEIADAMKAAHLGVSAFLTKPLKKDALLTCIQGVLETSGIDRSFRGDEFAPAIIFKSTAMAELLDRSRLVAAVDSTVLIFGSTGTGKELLAKAIHEGGQRNEAPFVSVNCSALPEQLLESELFGHEKGAFSGAINRHEGLFRSADGGTLFLDEIGDMPLSLQSKLLRVLQDFEVRPVGSTKTYSVDVRIISATHRDLEQAVEEGEFREDLYYRLGVVPLHMPALAERRDDIAPITEHLLSGLCERHGFPKKHLAPEAKQVLASASWPGNVRQLGNVIEQCVVLSSSEVIPLDLVKTALRERPGEMVPLDEAKQAFERDYLIGVLRITEGQVSNAARLAGRNRTDFYKLLGKHGLNAADFRTED